MQAKSISWCVALICCGTAYGVDVSRPAAVRFTLRDADRKPVAGAKVTLSREDGSEPISVVTDDKGVAAFSRKADRGYEWREHLVIEKDGYIGVDGTEGLFCGEDLERDIRFTKQRVTNIQVRGPRGEPAVGVPLTFWHEFQYSDGGQVYQTSSVSKPGERTNERGQYAWVHGPIVGDFTVRAAEELVRSPDADKVEVTLTEEEFQRVGMPHPLRGKLLLPYGTPAKDWLVGAEVTRDASGGIVAGIAIPVNRYLVARWQRVGADGGFATDLPGKYLVLLSPEGLPLVYPINPEMWPAGPHEVTLTVPPVVRTVSGQLVDKESKPLAGVPVYPNDMAGHMRWWQVDAGEGATSGAVSSHLKEGPEPGRVVSDAAGKFSFPVYAAMYYTGLSMGDNGPGTRYSARGNVDAGGVITLERYVPAESHPEDYKDITLVFVDGAGKRVDGPWVERLTAPAGTDNMQYGESPFKDTRGAHYFVKKEAREINIETQAGLWKGAKRTIPLKGVGDETISFVLDDALRQKPVHGRLVEADGRPISNVGIGVYDESEEPNRGTGGRHYFQNLGARTDAKGVFEIAGAPDDCKLFVSGLDIDGIAIDADHRDVVIHAPAVGGVYILLPKALKAPARWSEPGAPVRYDPADHSITYPRVPVGAFRLTARMMPELVDAEDDVATQIMVQPGEIAEWNLRNMAVLQPLKPIQREVTILVTADGKAVSGAEVAVFRVAVRTSEMEQWVQRWRAAASPKAEAAAVEKLRAAGTLALDALAALKGDAALDARVAKLRQELSTNWDGLSSATLDLADTSGHVRLLADVGEEYVAVARLRGKYAGWARFEVPMGLPAGLGRIEMRPVRSLLVQESGMKGMTLTVSQPGGVEGRALARLLQDDEVWGGGTVPQRGDAGAGGVVTAGVPVGITCECDLQAPAKGKKQVTIVAGTGWQVVDMDGP